jgi:hypothetical protein
VTSDGERESSDLGYEVALAVLAVILGTILGVLGAFLVPVRLEMAPFLRWLGPLKAVSIGVVFAVVTNVAICAALRILARHRWIAWLPIAGWLVAAQVLGGQRAEGDLVLPGGSGLPAGLWFLLLGLIAAPFGVTLPEFVRQWRTRPRSSVSPSGR